MDSKARLLGALDRLGQLGTGTLGARGRAGADALAIALLTQLNLWLWVEPGARWPLGALNLLALVFLLGSARRVSPVRRQLTHAVPWQRAWLHTGIATALLGGALVVAALVSGRLEPDLELAALGKPPERIPLWLLGKAVACAAQQLLLLWLLFPLMFVTCGNRSAAVLASAVLFAVAHVPNPILMLLTWIMAVVWLWLFQAQRHWLPLVAGHVLLALLLRWAVPSHVHLDLNVGARAVGEQREVIWLDEHGLWPEVQRLSSRAFFDAAGGSDTAFIHALYREVLGRDESPAENRTWQRARRHHTRMDVVIDFYTSREYCQRHGLTHPYSGG